MSETRNLSEDLSDQQRSVPEEVIENKVYSLDELIPNTSAEAFLRCFELENNIYYYTKYPLNSNNKSIDKARITARLTAQQKILGINKALFKTDEPYAVSITKKRMTRFVIKRWGIRIEDNPHKFHEFRQFDYDGIYVLDMELTDEQQKSLVYRRRPLLFRRNGHGNVYARISQLQAYYEIFKKINSDELRTPKTSLQTMVEQSTEPGLISQAIHNNNFLYNEPIDLMLNQQLSESSQQGLEEIYDAETFTQSSTSRTLTELNNSQTSQTVLATEAPSQLNSTIIPSQQYEELSLHGQPVLWIDEQNFDAQTNDVAQSRSLAEIDEKITKLMRVIKNVIFNQLKVCYQAYLQNKNPPIQTANVHQNFYTIFNDPVDETTHRTFLLLAVNEKKSVTLKKTFDDAKIPQDDYQFMMNSEGRLRKRGSGFLKLLPHIKNFSNQITFFQADARVTLKKLFVRFKDISKMVEWYLAYEKSLQQDATNHFATHISDNSQQTFFWHFPEDPMATGDEWSANSSFLAPNSSTLTSSAERTLAIDDFNEIDEPAAKRLCRGKK